MGYQHRPQFVIVPLNGLPSEYDLATATDLGPKTVTVSWEPDTRDRLTLDRERKPWIRGWRRKVLLVLEDGITGITTATVIALSEALSRADVTVWFSLDGGDWRAVTLGALKGPRAIADKPAIGMTWEMELIDRDLSPAPVSPPTITLAPVQAPVAVREYSTATLPVAGPEHYGLSVLLRDGTGPTQMLACLRTAAGDYTWVVLHAGAV